MPTPRARLAVVTLAAAIGLVACGGTDDEPTQDAAPAPTDSATGDPARLRVVNVEITDGRVSTDEDRVELAPGSTVRLVVTSDVDDELHVHGVDETAAIVAGEPTTLEFTLDEPGLFEVETHGSDLLLLQLLVQ
jgi:plastocyanin